MAEKVLHKTVGIKAPVSKVWDALTDPKVIKEWLFGTHAKSLWKVGEPIVFSGTWQGTEYSDKGTILEFERHKVLEYDYWSGFSGLPDQPENYSIIRFELRPSGKTTELTLRQSKFPNDSMYEHSSKNWDITLDTLKKVIEQQ